MNQALADESSRLASSWMRHEQSMLRDYLVADVEDPRINVQSILSRHFLAFNLAGERVQPLAEQELRFAGAMNWLLQAAKDAGDRSDLQAIHHALQVGSDNAEGLVIPHFLSATYANLPHVGPDVEVPNYIDRFLEESGFEAGELRPAPAAWNVFQLLWPEVLAKGECQPATVLEPACGSANDYRFLEAYGLASRIGYTGVDICEKNVANARVLFPEVDFRTANLFELDAADGAYDLSFVHDLFEHLSPEGIAAGVEELCRVTRHSLCVGFFSMDEIADHVIQPTEEYHWNRLSMRRMREMFAARGFDSQVFHIGSLLRWRVGCKTTHNPHAYTFVLGRKDPAGSPLDAAPDRG